jgi:hypothetical protein
VIWVMVRLSSWHKQRNTIRKMQQMGGIGERQAYR